MLKNYIQLARPKHWIKNSVVLFPIVFGLKYDQPQAWLSALLATVVFCFAASFIYVINDVLDVESDKQHPKKKDRPIASGRISKKQALIFSSLLFVVTLVLCFFQSVLPTMVVIAYLILQLLYITCFKYYALVDVISLSLGFVLRAVAGAVAIKVFISPWLFICMFTIFLFMGFCKRYNERAVIECDETAKKHRKTLLCYTPELLSHLITTSAGIAIVSFLAYGLSETTIERFGTSYFVYTLPMLVYSVFRFAMLSMQGVYSGPTELILSDRPFEISTGFWAIAIVCIIVFGRDIQSWLVNLY